MLIYLFILLTWRLKYFGQETIAELHRRACDIFDLSMEQVIVSYDSATTASSFSVFILNLLFSSAFTPAILLLESFLTWRYAFGITMAAGNMHWWTTWIKHLMMPIYRWIKMWVLVCSTTLLEPLCKILL